MGEKRQKHNPGILDWIFDFLVKPIVAAFPALVDHFKELIEEANMGVPQTAVRNTVEEFSLPYAALYIPSSPTTPEEAYKKGSDWLTKADVAYSGICGALIAAEAGSLGAIDTTLMSLFNIPSLRVWLGTAERIAEARDEASLLIPLRRYYLKQHVPLLPGYQDMIGIYVREGYLPEKWTELPSEFTENMKELGYSEDWTRRLWGKHWVLPGVELLYDMYHKKIIDYPTLALMLKFHDFEPEWRDRLIRNAYELIPRVDLRRAYMYAVPGYEDLVEPYEKLGYSPEDAQTMDRIAKRFALEAHYTRLLTVARAAYRKGQLPGPEFQAIMEEVHVPPAAQDLILQAETLARLSSVKDPGEEPYMPSRSDMRWMAEWGQISPEELRDLAEADGIDPAWSPRVTEAWLLNQQRDELAKVRAVYERRLREGFMIEADFAKALQSLHYAGHVVEALERWADEELDLQERLEEAKEHEALAKEGVITLTEYGQALRDLGMTEERITRSQKHIERLLAIKAAKAKPKAKG